MVSRITPPDAPQTSRGGVAAALFEAWRVLLGTAFLRASRAASAGRRGSGTMLLARVAPVAAVAGTAAGLAAGTLSDGTVRGASLFVLESAAWAAFRLAAAILIVPGPAGRRRALNAWAAGLAPYLLGVTPGLRAVAFVASAVLTYRLLAVVEGPRTAARAVAWGFGGQTAAGVLAWVVVNGLLFLPLLSA